ncbi:MAG: phosphoenolpyruvate--protein phosphotransferase [Nitriliruptoraceae bacterium]
MTVGIVVVSHSAALATAAAELAAEMAGDRLRLALAGGIDDDEAPLGTDAVKVMAAIEEVDSEAGVLVLMDLGSAVLSAEMALDLLPPETAARVVLCEAPIVEGLIAAAVQASAGAPIDEVAAEARRGLDAKASHLGVVAASPTTSAAEVGDGPLVALQLTVPNELGFHARPAARVVELLGGLDADVQVTDRTSGRGPVPARSMNGLITLGARRGHEVTVEARGPDAAEALARIEALVADNLGDPVDASGGRPPAGTPGPGGAGGTGTPAAPAVPGPDVDGVLVGIPAAPGLSVGAVHHLGGGQLPDLDTLAAAADAPADPAGEHARLDTALAAAAEQLAAAHRALEAQAGTEAAELVGTQRLVLSDPDLLEPARAAIDAGAGAARAWGDAVQQALAAYAEVDDAYLAERAGDLDAVGRTVLAALVGIVRDVPAPTGVVVAEDLSPAQTAQLDPDRVVAVVTASGSPTAHAALIARALGIAAVVAAGASVHDLPDGAEVVVDGDTGRVETRPDADRLAAAQVEVARRRTAAAELRATAQAPVATRDGTPIGVFANVGLPRDAARAAAEGADGVGLLRSEFLFLDRDEPPSEDEQVAIYREVCEAVGGRPVTLRTLDVGGDKPLPYLPLPREDNPFLGTRGVRLSLTERALFTTQLRAGLRVAAEHPLTLLVPMVATLDEVAAVREAVEQARAALEADGIDVPARPRLGVMVEVPSLALKAAHLVGLVDVVSIGTNDLTQYTLATERGNAAVDHLADPLDPGVLALIASVGRAATDTDLEVAVCGELASDPTVAAVLVGLGVRELSVPPVDVPAVKAAIRGIDLAQARQLAEQALGCASAAEVRALLG